MPEWHIFRGSDEPHDGMNRLPPPPPWRDFRARAADESSVARAYRVGPHEIELVNAALYLRRPLLVTGPPGVGKSTLAEAVARELKLGPVLRWSINSRSTLAEGLYQYDALARLRDANLRQHAGSATAEDIGRYVRLGPLGTALYPRPLPRVLLIDELDKSDIDLPNDLLHVFEDGRYEIPELTRIASEAQEVRVLPADGRDATDRVPIRGGRVRCDAFPVVFMTSNGERELPPAFLRRCLRLDIQVPDEERLRMIIEAHLGTQTSAAVRELVAEFVTRRGDGAVLATDQLLNAVFLVTQPSAPEGETWKALREAVLRELGRT
jgi:MoxR-like ATPase